MNLQRPRPASIYHGVWCYGRAFSPQPQERHPLFCSLFHNLIHFERHFRNDTMSSSLRQRQRREIVQNEAREVRAKKRLDLVQKGASNVMGKIYAIVLVSLVLLVIGVLSKVRPKLLPWNKPPVPRQVLALLYPNNIFPQRDLVPVVSNYAICTPDNLATRSAIRYVIRQREALKSRSLKVVLYPREHDQVEAFARTATFCGDNFEETFFERPPFVQDDLYLWCLLNSFRVQGIIEYGIDFHRSLRVYQNMAVQYAGIEHRIFSSLLVVTSDSTVPSRMLDWLLSNDADEWDESYYRQRMEEHLFQLIQGDNVHWTVLDAVCGGGEHSTFAARK